jgi:hypothetical protein
MVRRLFTVGSAFAAAVLAGSGPAVAAPSWLPDAAAQQVEGPFTADIVPCDADLCTAGELGGGLSATYSFTLDGAVGRSVITTRSGQLLGDDQVQLDWTSATTANFTTTVDIVGGTQRYGQADGVIVATGTLYLQRSPQIVGVYAGMIEIVPGSAAN